jgi:hypothetical protein
MPSSASSSLSFLQPLILSIVGGAIVAFANHGFQTRREFIKSRREELENIAQRVDNLIYLCKKLNDEATNFGSGEEAEKFSIDIFKLGKRVEIDKARIEIATLVRIHYHRYYDTAATLSNSADKFVIEVASYCRKQLASFATENRAYFSSDEPHIQILQAMMMAGEKLKEQLITQTRKETHGSIGIWQPLRQIGMIFFGQNSKE